MAWDPNSVQNVMNPPAPPVKPPIVLGRATSIGAMPNTGLLSAVRNWIQGNVPESILKAGENLQVLGQILGLDSPASAYSGGMNAGAGAIIPKIESEAQPFAAGLKKLAQSVVKAEPSGSQVQDSWILTHPGGGSMEVTFGDNSARVDQVRSGSKQGQGIGSALYEKLGQMMKDRGIPGNAITGDIQGDAGKIKHLRSKAAAIAGEGNQDLGRYELQ